MNPVRAAIFAKLADSDDLVDALADGADGICHRAADTDIVPPFVIMHKQAGTPSRFMRNDTVLENELWLVKGVCRGETGEDAEAIHELIIDALDNRNIEIDGHVAIKLLRTEDIDYGEISDGDQWHHVGALYRVTSQRQGTPSG